MKLRLTSLLRSLAVTAAAALLASGLSSCNQQEIDDINARLDALEAGTIPPVNQQITEIQNALSKLQAMDTELKGLITALEQKADSMQKELDQVNADLAQAKLDLAASLTAANQDIVNVLAAQQASLQAQLDNINAAITALQAKDVAIEARIDELKAYVDGKDTATRDWVTATFSTLEQYAQTVEELATIKTGIQTLQTTLTADYTSKLAAAVTALEASLQTWVGTLLPGYWTIAETQAKLDALEAAYKAADQAQSDQLPGIQTALNTAKSDLTAAYQAAIATAITEHSGVITTKLAEDIATAKADLQTKIDALNTRIDGLEARVTALEGDVARILAAVQSVVVVPDYSDGSVRLTGLPDTDTLRFQIYPLSAARQLVDAGKEAFKLEYMEVESVASDTLAVLPVTGVKMDSIYVLVATDATALRARIKDGHQSSSARLVISDGTVTRGTNFFPLFFSDPIYSTTIGYSKQAAVRFQLYGQAIVDNEDQDVSFGFAYAKSPGEMVTNPTLVYGTELETDGTYSLLAEGLASYTKYYYRSFLNKNGKSYYGDMGIFITTQAISDITLSDSKLVVFEEASLYLTATVTPNDADRNYPFWKSSDDEIVYVSSSVTTTCVFTGYHAGEAAIIAYADDGSGVEASCAISVRAPQERTDWTITYDGTNGEGKSVISVSGVEGGYFVEEDTGGPLANVLQDYEHSLNYYYHRQNITVVPKTGDQSFTYDRFPVGTKKFYLVGIDAEGHLTGEYKKLTVNIEPTAEMEAAYDLWLGDWEIDHRTVTIAEASRALATYTVTGLFGVDLAMPLQLGWDCELVFPNGYVTTVSSGEVGMYGLTSSSSFSTSKGVAATATFDDDSHTAATVAGSGTTVTLAILRYNSGWYYHQSGSAMDLPFAMTRPDPVLHEDTAVVAGTYASFIGSWQYNGYDITVEEKNSGVDYTVTIPYYAGLPSFTAVYNSGNGTMEIYAQDLTTFEHGTYGTCTRHLSGKFLYNSSEYNTPYYPFYGDANLIVELKLHESGNLTFHPGSCPYGDYMGFTYVWTINSGEYQGMGNWSSTFAVDSTIAVTPAPTILPVGRPGYRMAPARDGKAVKPSKPMINK